MARKILYFTIAIITAILIITGIGLGVFYWINLSKCPDGSFRKAAVAADSEICSDVGRDILKEGGSAADGAIAALLCTSVVNPQCMGIGGGVIFTIMDKNGTVKIFNTREAVPKTFRGNLSDCSYDSTGSQWIGVPGDIRGYERVHKLYGRLPWSSLFQPTIRMAREGVKISKILARYLPIAGRHSTRQLFVDAEGNMLKEGDTVKYEKLADTLEKIAERGAEEFYTGETAKNLITDIQEAGGSITLEDLRSVEVTEVEPWNVSLGDYTMYFPPPPSGGALVSFILNVMEGYKPNPASLEGKERVPTYHRYIEACKFAKGLRKFMRDPRFNDITNASKIIQKEFADYIRKKITDNSTHDPEYYSVTPAVDRLGTTHISVLDEDGMAVSVTSSINFIFGSGEYSPKTGIILNNMLTDFCKETDQVQAGERPPSSTATMILHSKVTNHTVVIGGSGGTMITTGMTMALMNFLWFGKSLKDSIATPVITLIDKKELNFEPDFDKEVIVALRVLGHKIPIFQNAVNALSKKNGECIQAVSDARKLAKAAGY
ncbi:hypothetical protein MHYP_G00347610 [Metynnis hypsauchen]